jgi:hypothetical protein
MLLGGQGFWILILVFSVWLLILTVWVFITVRHYRRLVGDTKREDLKNILEGLFEKQDQVEQNFQKVLATIGNFERKSAGNIQKIGIEKFNPYSEAGGNHSFALCFLDGNENGFILLSLHSREDTRLYLKEVKQGRAEYELSKEEQQALAKAKSSNKVKQ